MRPTWLRRWVRIGSLRLYMPGGRTIAIGDGEPAAHMQFHRKAALRRILRDPHLAFGETYMNEGWTPGQGGLLAIFEMYYRNAGMPRRFGRVATWLRRAHRTLQRANDRLRARHNVHVHYDLDADLFRSFLDADLQYSCAYFYRAGLSLEAAQRAKCEHIARKLCLSPGDRVLDIGSGWGGLALYLAREWGVIVTGLTLSEDQYLESTRRAASAGLVGRAGFFQQDYREHQGSYDAIVSVGMFEHVGLAQYQTFFDTVRALLAPRGRAVLHTIGRSGPPVETTRSWISRHIFPGGYIPSLSEAAVPMERSGLVLSDLEVWRRHYALTLGEWNARFQKNRDYFRTRHGERFCRMWEFYLLGSQAIFTWGDLVVFQFQLAHANDVLPPSRAYLYESTEAPAPTVRQAG